MKRRGTDCWVIALGTNDAMHTRGDRPALRRAIAEALTITGDDPVVWITPQTRWRGMPAMFGPSDANMGVVCSELAIAARHHPNLRISHWERVAKPATDFWLADGIHLASGKSLFADFVVSQVRRLVEQYHTATNDRTRKHSKSSGRQGVSGR